MNIWAWNEWKVWHQRFLLKPKGKPNMICQFSAILNLKIQWMWGSKQGSSKAWAIIGVLNRDGFRHFFSKQFIEGVLQALAVFTVVLKQSTIHGYHRFLFIHIFDGVSSYFLQDTQDPSSCKTGPTCCNNVAKLNHDLSCLKGGIGYLK